jgi:MFS family permease
MFVIGIACLTAAVFWELHHPDPVIEFRILKVRNFAISCVFYFIFGVGLFASTTMIPQILQSLYGYRAIDAGLVLGPGALVITFLAPVGAQFVQRGFIKPRILLFGAVMVVGMSFIHYSHFNLDTDYRHYALARALQGFGYAFFFVPLSVISYSQLSPAQNNKASSLTNFFRNWGGSFGIAFVTTMSERRQNFHQATVGSNLTSSSPFLQTAVKQTAAYLQAHGFSHADALNAAYARYYDQLGAQTRLLAFMDCFYVLGLITLPLLWFCLLKILKRAVKPRRLIENLSSATLPLVDARMLISTSARFHGMALGAIISHARAHCPELACRSQHHRDRFSVDAPSLWRIRTRWKAASLHRHWVASSGSRWRLYFVSLTAG